MMPEWREFWQSLVHPSPVPCNLQESVLQSFFSEYSCIHTVTVCSWCSASEIPSLWLWFHFYMLMFLFCDYAKINPWLRFLIHSLLATTLNPFFATIFSKWKRKKKFEEGFLFCWFWRFAVSFSGQVYLWHESICWTVDNAWVENRQMRGSRPVQIPARLRFF